MLWWWLGEVVVEEGRGGDISISRRGALSINDESAVVYADCIAYSTQYDPTL